MPSSPEVLNHRAPVGYGSLGQIRDRNPLGFAREAHQYHRLTIRLSDLGSDGLLPVRVHPDFTYARYCPSRTRIHPVLTNGRQETRIHRSGTA